jgi:dihydrofolate reductase
MLVYSAIASLDGYVADREGRFDWAVPDAEVHAAVNELERGIGTYLYGRRMYQVMRFWAGLDPDGPLPEGLAPDSLEDVARDYARIWQAADKVVFSRTLDAVDTPRTTLLRSYEPDDVRRLVASATGDVSVGGPGLAAAAWRAGLVQECHLFLNPVLVGGGTPALPEDVRFGLDLLNQNTFAGGVVHLHHRVR